MSDFMSSCVERYLELAGKTASSLRQVDTPFIEITQEGPDRPTGALQPIAARVLMKILYGARMARYDLLRPTCYLATRITKWPPWCDRSLHRLVCYINCTLDVRMTTWVGNPLSEWELVIYSDADLAGDRETSRSTSGVYMCIRASHTFVTLQGISKRQTSVSRATAEAELVAADMAIRREALPALQLWEQLTSREMVVTLMEDSMSAITIMKTGRNPNMSHMSRTHRIIIGFMHEVVSRGQISLCHFRTSDMCADVFTKHFTNKITWQNCVDKIAHVNPKRMWKSKGSRGEKKALASNPSTTQKHNRTLVEFCCGPTQCSGNPVMLPMGVV